MTFKRAVQATPNLGRAWMPGLRALRTRDRRHVVAANPSQFRGSADVDSALQQHEPNAHRWDYAIGYRHTNRGKDCIYWVEVHTANDNEVNVVLDKLGWLRNWLAGDGKLLNQFERDFVWVSSGATSLTLGAPQLKRIAQHGLQRKGRVLRIPAAR